MNVVIAIKRRESIPVRALPYVSHALSPARIAAGLGSRGGLLSLFEDRPLLSDLRAYFLENGEPVEIPPHTWLRYVRVLDAMEEGLPLLDAYSTPIRPPIPRAFGQ
jgi:hypothetical protein